MIDLHAHLSQWGKEELKWRKERGIHTCFSTGTPGEWQRLESLWKYGFQTGEFLVSFGIHPWYSSLYTVRECREYLEKCDLLGEIGMDSVWCEIPLDIQQKRLEEQLLLAADLKKPIILHTKGQERRIGEMIKDFPEKVCVHWYSGKEEDLEAFLIRDCYFTLGPDTASKGKCAGEDGTLCRKLAEEIPVERIFLETDGLDAIAWAHNKDRGNLWEIQQALEENLEYTADCRGLGKEKLEFRMEENLLEFLNAPKGGDHI